MPKPASMDPDYFQATASIKTLQKRAGILNSIRQFFHQQKYWEVETPLLSAESVIDRYLEPFQIPCANAFLQTSPEFAMKRLLACGADRIFQIGKAFRQEEAGTIHNPEFTMLEWYAVGETDQQQMDFTETLIQTLSAQFDQPLPQSFPRLTYEEAFREAMGVSILEMKTNELKDLAKKYNITYETQQQDENLSQSDCKRCDKDLWLNLLLAEKVEPFLKKKQAVFLYNYPASQSALAKISDEDGRLAQRFELYLQGIEICNGYNELTDAAEFEQRCLEQNKLRQADGLQQLPTPERFLAAMQSGLPNSSGVALGIDRLVMLLLKRKSLQEVVAFPHPLA